MEALRLFLWAFIKRCGPVYRVDANRGISVSSTLEVLETMRVCFHHDSGNKMLKLPVTFLPHAVISAEHKAIGQL